MNKVRCAIYTRKSSEEGLEQDFNSLHAQREACAAYILSQASEGWSLLPDEYDDGGLSGGTLERPALQRLLDDIGAGKIDIVVVYKVDRLTRSLLDFARLVETMDKAEVSFVSVTQSFNTTNSMGRLTLNMLLSFAQFEREVTAERIRDKIAASKAKGMWMGGNPPLGYRPEGRSLAIVEDHAELIRDLFSRYLEIGNVRLLKQQLDDEDLMVPERFASTGRRMGGVPFTRGQIYKILSNSIYTGRIEHKGEVYDGQHDAIVNDELWDAVQATLKSNRQGERTSANARSPSLLAGRVFDAESEPLVASHACKGMTRYRYYVSRSLQHKEEAPNKGWRVPAHELEKTVCEGIVRELRQPLALVDKLGSEHSPHKINVLLRQASTLADQVAKRQRMPVRQLVDRVCVQRDGIVIDMLASELASNLGLDNASDGPTTVTIAVPASLRRSGRAMKLLLGDGISAATPEPQQHLVRLILRAKILWQEMLEKNLTPSAIAREHGISSSRASRLIRLNFLAPDIIGAIASGTQPAALDAQGLLDLHDLPLEWSAQKQLLNIN
ncbi:recombinase family protein [Erythrobacter alti]|uniref:recombinase family protein n=1 Tax=Erythrobacter alti TaxID=1896145 RepID=UPI0030F394E3